MNIQSTCTRVGSVPAEYRRHTLDMGSIRGFERPRTGAPIERFERAAGKLERSAERGRSLNGLHPFCSDTPVDAVLSTTRMCEEAIEKFRGYPPDSMRITTTGDLVNAADTLLRIESNGLEASQERLQKARTTRITKYGLAASAIAGAVAGGFALPSGPLQAGLLAAGVIGGISVMAMFDKNSNTNATVRYAADSVSKAQSNLAAAQNYSVAAHAWDGYFEK